MYTPLLGRRLLDRANLRDGSDRTPAEFFDEVFFPLVFDDEQYLMTAGNSKFGQLVNNRKKNRAAAEKEGRAWDETEWARLRTEALADFHVAAVEVEEPEGHLVLGGYASGLDGTTSGQVTSLNHDATADEVYLSWIGAASGAGVAGGLVLLIDHDDVLDAVLEGWRLYRRVLTESKGVSLKANQMETWNGQWLRHRFSATFRPEDPTAFLPSALKTTAAGTAIETVPWARLLLSLGQTLGDEPVSAYVYSLGQTNSTLGFVPLHLGETGVLRDSYATVRDFYRGLFGVAVDQATVSPDKLDDVYDAGAGFARACAQGAVGLAALEPAKIRDFLPTGKNKTPRPVTPETAQTPLLYQTWIHAMLGYNRTALYDRARDTAELLFGVETGALGGKNNLKKPVAEALGAKSLPGLVDGLTEIADAITSGKTTLSDEDAADTLAALDGLVRDGLDLSQERFYLFLSLLRFQVALLRGKASTQ